MSYELLVLGTAAMTASRTRNQNGYLLRWERELIMLDPGEGMQRQLLAAGASAAQITRVCITHFHGDHCLGLPGILQRRSIDSSGGAIDVYFPASGRDRLRSLVESTEWDPSTIELRLHPAADGACFPVGDDTTLVARALDHTVEAVGWRIEQGRRRHFLTERLRALGIEGPDIGRLRDRGWIEREGRRVALDEVSEWHRGRCVAVVMDTRPCTAAVDLARDADLLVCEATYLERDGDLAARGGHLTAADAGRIARDAGAGLLVLTHFSDRYDDVDELVAEARRYAPDVVAAEDLTTIPVPAPPRRSDDG